MTTALRLLLHYDHYYMTTTTAATTTTITTKTDTHPTITTTTTTATIRTAFVSQTLGIAHAPFSHEHECPKQAAGIQTGVATRGVGAESTTPRA
jgi:hypothetical protein